MNLTLSIVSVQVTKKKIQCISMNSFDLKAHSHKSSSHSLPLNSHQRVKLRGFFGVFLGGEKYPGGNHLYFGFVVLNIPDNQSESSTVLRIRAA